MSTPLPSYTDGLFSPDAELTVIPRVKYPFANNPTPDVYSKYYERDYQIVPSLYQMRIANRTSWTNLFLYSSEFTNAAWTQTNVTATYAVGTAPDGATTLNKLLETVTNGVHEVTQAVVAGALRYEFSCFFTTGLGRDFVQLIFVDSSSTTFYAYFDIASGRVYALSAGVTAQVVFMGNGAYRCSAYFTTSAGSGTAKIRLSTNGVTTSYAGDVTKGLYLWGAQMTAIASGNATPYIGTTGSSRTVSSPDLEATINSNAKSPDPMASLVAETDPNVLASRVGSIMRTFSRIPNQQIIPCSYLFTAPNYTPSRWAPSALAPPQNAFQTVSTYAIVALLGVVPGNEPTDAKCAVVSGYYDVERSITAYTGTPATVIRVPSHNCVAGSVLLYARTLAGQKTYYYFTVSSVSSDDLTGTSTLLTDDTVTYGLYGFAIVVSAVDKVRKRTKQTADTGQTISLSGRQIENSYLPGVSSGITTAADIPSQSPFTLATFLAALATGSGWFNVQADAIVPWKGPILVQRYMQADISDFL